MNIEVGKLVPDKISKCFYYDNVTADARKVGDYCNVSWLTIINHARGHLKVTNESHLAIIELMKLALIRFEKPLKEMKESEKTFKKLLKQ